MFASIGHMKASGGVILNMASIAGSSGLSDRFAYSMSKGAVIAMTYSVAKDYLRHNIRCNCMANRLHASVNNAGVNDSVSLEKRGPEEFAALLRRNLLHYYNMAHDALPSLKAATRAFVNIASKVAFTGRGGASVYAASKGTILALTGEWAAAPLPGGVRVNRAGPAEGMTPLYRQWLDTIQNPNEKRAAVVANFPPGKRRTAAEEIAATTVFLASAKSGHTTRQ